MLFSAIAVFFAASSNLLEKIFFQRNRRLVDRGIIAYLFLCTFIILSLILFPVFGEVADGAFDLIPLIMLVGVGILGFSGNILYYYGFPKEHLSEIQPFTVATPLLTILLAGIFYSDERDIMHFLIALFAGVVLVLTHTNGRSLKFNPGLIPIVVSIVFFASEVLLVKELLHYFNPIALYTYRVGIIAILLLAVFRPSVRLLLQQKMFPFVLIPLMWIGSIVFAYMSVGTIGIVETTLVLMMTPILTVVGSYVFLKEDRINREDIVALILILGCVIAAQFVS